MFTYGFWEARDRAQLVLYLIFSIWYNVMCSSQQILNENADSIIIQIPQWSVEIGTSSSLTSEKNRIKSNKIQVKKVSKWKILEVFIAFMYSINVEYVNYKSDLDCL